MTQFSKNITFSAPGKVILSGEHAVVYGYPALVAAIDRRVSLNLTFNQRDRHAQILGVSLTIKSEALAGGGLGSSATLAVLEAAALSYIVKRKLNQEKICRIAHQIENLAHGNSSGVDPTVVTYGGIMVYQKFKGFKSLKFKRLPELLLINTGKPAETTGEMVEMISLKPKTRSSKLLAAIGQLPEQFVKALKVGNLSYLSDLIKKNERLLEELGVVGKKAQKIIRQIEALAGAAKICGAGGVKQGSGIALVYHPNPNLIKQFCQRNKLEFYEVKLGEEGVRIENRFV